MAVTRLKSCPSRIRALRPLVPTKSPAKNRRSPSALNSTWCTPRQSGSLAITWPVLASRMSVLATTRPSPGVKQRKLFGNPSDAAERHTVCPEATSQRVTLALALPGPIGLSPLAVSTSVPAELSLACATGSSCLKGGESGLPLAASQTRAVLSALAVTTRLPSTFHSRKEMAPPCSNCGVNGRPVVVSQICATACVGESVVAVTILLPSRLSLASVKRPPADQT